MSLFLSLCTAEFVFGYTATKIVVGKGGADIPRMTRTVQPIYRSQKDIKYKQKCPFFVWDTVVTL
jgi:hypothetical protein